LGNGIIKEVIIRSSLKEWENKFKEFTQPFLEEVGKKKALEIGKSKTRNLLKGSS